MVFNGKLWVIGGFDGSNRLDDVWSSEDGVTWEEATDEADWDARSGHSSVVFDGKMWVIGGFGANRLGDVWSSEDGANWTQVNAATNWSSPLFSQQRGVQQQAVGDRGIRW